MKTRGKGMTQAVVVLLVLAGGLVFGLSELVRFRFEKGDGYPEYSTFRKDALGCGVLYESLGLLPDLQVARQLKPTWEPEQPEAVTLFWLGGNRNLRLDRPLLEFVASGGHLVYTVGQRRLLDLKPETEAQAERRNERAEHKIGLRYDPHAMPTSGLQLMEPVGEGLSIPVGAVDGFGGGGFVDLDESWSVIYEVSDVPTVVRRSWEKGTLTFVSDTYAMSNESLLEAPAAHFVHWLLMDRDQVFFDEMHLGVVSQGGMVSLLRRYHLGPAYGAFLVLGLLTVWWSSRSLLPKTDRMPDETASAPELNHAGGRGIAGLVQRHIKKEALFGVCVQRWLAAVPHLGSRARRCQPEVERLAAEAASEAVDPIARYRSAALLLRDLKKK